MALRQLVVLALGAAWYQSTGRLTYATECLRWVATQDWWANLRCWCLGVGAWFDNGGTAATLASSVGRIDTGETTRWVLAAPAGKAIAHIMASTSSKSRLCAAADSIPTVPTFKPVTTTQAANANRPPK